MKRLFASACLLGLTVSAQAQSFNIDINRSGNSAPSASFGAAAGQTGFWNSITAAASGDVTLLDTTATASGVMITKKGNGATNTTIGSGDFNALMGDYDLRTGQNVNIEYDITGLDAGVYRVYVYMALAPSAASYFDNGVGQWVYYGLAGSVFVDSNIKGFVVTQGPITPGTFEFRKTHDAVSVQLPSNSTLKVQGWTGASNNDRAVINGIQLVKYNAPRLYVDLNSHGLNTGLSWADAFTDLQDALKIAGLTGSGVTEIWVANGIYKPGTSRYDSFEIPSGVKIYGGFAGGETQLAQRNWISNPAILSGNIGDPVSVVDDSIHLVTASNTNSATRLDGFSIVRGHANTSGTDAIGGGMYIADAGYLSVANCRFADCYALDGGAGVYVGGHSLPDFQYCIFERNQSPHFGGAIRNVGTSRFWAVNTIFRNNEAWNDGGAISTTSSTSLIFGCLFQGNEGDGMGGAICVSGSGVGADIRNCTISGNRGGTTGGVAVTNNATAAIRNSIVFGNDDWDSATAIETEEINEFTGGVATVSHSLVYGWTAAGTGGVGNFTAQSAGFYWAYGPDNLLGTEDDDFSLGYLSVCLDRGALADAPYDVTDLNHNGNTTEPLPFDLLGNPRLADIASVTNLNGSTIDLGAYERRATLPGDMNCDGAVNNFDIDPFVIALTDPFTYNFLYSNCNPLNGDANHDGLFNNFDIDPFVVCVTNFGCP